MDLQILCQQLIKQITLFHHSQHQLFLHFQTTLQHNHCFSYDHQPFQIQLLNGPQQLLKFCIGMVNNLKQRQRVLLELSRGQLGNQAAQKSQCSLSENSKSLPKFELILDMKSKVEQILKKTNQSQEVFALKEENKVLLKKVGRLHTQIQFLQTKNRTLLSQSNRKINTLIASIQKLASEQQSHLEERLKFITLLRNKDSLIQDLRDWLA